MSTDTDLPTLQRDVALPPSGTSDTRTDCLSLKMEAEIRTNQHGLTSQNTTDNTSDLVLHVVIHY